MERCEWGAWPGRVCGVPHPFPAGVGQARPPGGLQGEGGGGRPRQGRAASNP